MAVYTGNETVGDYKEFAIFLTIAEDLHSGKSFGGGTMFDQVQKTGQILLEGTPVGAEVNIAAVIAGIMNKSWEQKRIGADKTPLNMGEIVELVNSVHIEDENGSRDLGLEGEAVVTIMDELTGEPEDKAKSKIDQWKEKAEWAKALSPEAQQVLMAEKIVNLGTPPANDEGPKNYAWYTEEYLPTRMIMVDALKEDFPNLHAKAVEAHDAGLQIIAKRQKFDGMAQSMADRLSGNVDKPRDPKND